MERALSQVKMGKEGIVETTSGSTVLQVTYPPRAGLACFD